MAGLWRDLCLLVLFAVFVAGAPRKDPYHPWANNDYWNADGTPAHQDDDNETIPERPGIVPPPKGQEEWRRIAQDALHEALRHEELNRNVAKNVIIFIADGMGITTSTAARLFMNDVRGTDETYGEEGFLSFEKFPHVAFSKTYNSDWQTPDSAGSATAILCGTKTIFSTIGVDDTVTHQMCHEESAEVDSIIYWAEEAGKSTGVVTNTAITHATPAAAYASVASRVWESDGDMPPFFDRNCSDIALQLIERGHDIEVAMGGGRTRFFGRFEQDPSHETGTGDRRDGRNLIEEWKEDKENKGADHAVVYSREEMLALDTQEIDYLFGLFRRGHMSYDQERNEYEPSLTEMVETAIEILQKNDEGYVLMVEGGRIDMAHHSSRAWRALYDTLAFSDAVERAVEMTNDDETLIIVTADHSHVMALAGYHLKGAHMLETGIYPGRDLMPYTRLLYGNGPGFDPTHENGRENISTVDTTQNGYVFQSAVPMDSETHGGEDVAIYARGPMAHLIQGVQEQHYIAHVAGYASCLGENQGHCEDLDLSMCPKLTPRVRALAGCPENDENAEPKHSDDDDNGVCLRDMDAELFQEFLEFKAAMMAGRDGLSGGSQPMLWSTLLLLSGVVAKLM